MAKKKRPGFLIYTICTHDYKDAYDLVIDSWLKKTSAYKILVYTDKKWDSGKERVSIIERLPEVRGSSDRWLSAVRWKRKLTEEVLGMMAKGDSAVFMDIDCYLLGDIGDVFQKDFDLAVTRLFTGRRLTVSTGIFWFRKTDYMVHFMTSWERIEKILKSKKKDRARACSNNQRSFSDAARTFHRLGHMKIKDMNHGIWNRKFHKGHLERNDLMDQVRTKKIKVLHFYNNSYREPGFIEELFKRGAIS